MPGHSLTTDMTDGGTEIITGGKQINVGTLRCIFSFRTDKRRPHTVATSRLITFADGKVTESQVPLTRQPCDAFAISSPRGLFSRHFCHGAIVFRIRCPGLVRAGQPNPKRPERARREAQLKPLSKGASLAASS